MRTTTFCLLFVGALVVGAVGCGARDHMNPEYGRKSNRFFKQQQVYSEPTTGAPSGLDSEEAAAINNNYRKQLGARPSEEPTGSRVMILQPPPEYK